MLSHHSARKVVTLNHPYAVYDQVVWPLKSVSARGTLTLSALTYLFA